MKKACGKVVLIILSIIGIIFMAYGAAVLVNNLRLDFNFNQGKSYENPVPFGVAHKTTTPLELEIAIKAYSDAEVISFKPYLSNKKGDGRHEAEAEHQFALIKVEIKCLENENCELLDLQDFELNASGRVIEEADIEIQNPEHLRGAVISPGASTIGILIFMVGAPQKRGT